MCSAFHRLFSWLEMKPLWRSLTVSVEAINSRAKNVLLFVNVYLTSKRSPAAVSTLFLLYLYHMSSCAVVYSTIKKNTHCTKSGRSELRHSQI